MFALALQDLTEAFTRWHLWIYLAWSEIRLRYRRSTLGPWWITLSMGIFVNALSIVYSRIFHHDLLAYLPFLVCGMLIWTFISTSIIDSSMMFRNYQSFIKQIKLPYLIYPLRHLSMNVIIFAHNFFIYVLLLFICPIPIGPIMLLAIPGFLLIVLNVLWVSMLVGMIGTRYRDVPQIINSLIQIVFFISPITWMPKLVGENSLILKLNPVLYLLDVARSPLLGELPHIRSWVIVTLFCIAGNLFTFLFFCKYRSRISFWIE